ncbi:MAG: hypothetical protein FWB97_10675, partial [Oscillospiraceae bacterium]|nr:hypothetical protein [Oscillospiraceae bacterium]
PAGPPQVRPSLLSPTGSGALFLSALFNLQGAGWSYCLCLQTENPLRWILSLNAKDSVGSLLDSATIPANFSLDVNCTACRYLFVYPASEVPD